MCVGHVWTCFDPVEMAIMLTYVNGNTGQWFSRCQRSLWSVVKRLSWAERRQGGFRQHYMYVLLHSAQYVYGLIRYKWPERWLAFIWELFSRRWRTLRYVVECLPRMEGCSGGDVSSISHCIGFRKCVFVVWSSKMAKMAFMKETVF